MAKVLVLTVHPNPGMSRVNTAMARAAAKLDGVNVVDLYALYPRFKIDVAAEQERLVSHEVIVFQFPIHWYSMPSLLRQWQDDVLEHGFAYGEEGNKLAGKLILPAVTVGGSQNAYAPDGSVRFSLRTLLAPFEQTALFCRMRYLPPFVLFSSRSGSGGERIDSHVQRYVELLGALRDARLDVKQLRSRELLTDGPLPIKRGA